MERFAELYEYFMYFLGGLLVLLGLLAAFRILKKAKNRETVHIEPVGVFNDLPDTVTGLGKIEEKSDV